MNDTPLTPSEKLELKKMNITLTQINNRYTQAKRRSERRNQEILPRYAFYREFTRQLKEASIKLNTPADKLYPLLDVHAVNDGYKEFQLLLRPNHKILHSKLYRDNAEKILAKGTATCRHCQRELPLTEFPRDKRTLTGIIRTCKDCQKKIKAEKAALEVA